jgi:hypothetical protein
MGIKQLILLGRSASRADKIIHALFIDVYLDKVTC